MEKNNKYRLIPKGICKCRLCTYQYDLENEDVEREIYLCGCASVDNGVLVDTEAEIVWKCPECGQKNKDVKRIEIAINK